MRFAPRPPSWISAALVTLALAGCNGKEADKPAGAGTPGQAVAGAGKKPDPAEAPEAEAGPQPGEKGYVAPATGKPTPPLIQATASGNKDAVKALLDDGVDPNAAHSGVTALHIASAEGMSEIVEVLLEKGAQVDCRQLAKATPLHMASCSTSPNSLRVATLLIEKGADVNAKEKESVTPLMAAASNGLLEMVELLIDKGADLNAVDKWGATALHTAVRLELKEIAAVLLAKGANVNVPDGQKNTPLHYSARTGNREIAELLIANGADILAKTVEDGTAFQLAVFKEHEELGKYLQQLEIAAGGTGAEPPATTQKPAQMPKKKKQQ